MRHRLCRIALCATVALVLLAGHAAAAPTDEEVRNGDALQLLLPAIGWGLTFAYDDPVGRGQFYWSYFTTMGVTHALKLAKKEPRPNSGATHIKNDSYVSGHTASAFAGAAFMQMRYGWGYGLPAYAAAIYTGASRVDKENQSHYQGDVNRGAVIAIVTTWIFTSRYQTSRRRVAPILAPGYSGLALQMDW